MRVEYINPFIIATTNVFETMVNCKLTRGKIRVLNDESPIHPISGVIGLSGRAVGTVVLSLSEGVALRAASALLMTELTKIDDDVIDAVGELANMVAGGAKAKLDEYELSISLPSVITGAGHEVRFPSKVTPICVPFESDWGSLTIEVGLEQVAEPVGA